MLNPKTFKCTKCGECCRSLVKVDDSDVSKIKELGIKDFVKYDEDIEANVLKQRNGVCIFLKRNGNEFVCSIYNNRPKVCQKYPFIKGDEKLEDCRPRGWERWIEINKLLP